MKFKIGKIYEDKYDRYIFLCYVEDLCETKCGLILRIELKKDAILTLDIGMHSIKSMIRAIKDFNKDIK